MYDAIAFSLVFLLLSGVFLICAIGTAMPLFVNPGNRHDLMPLSFMGAKIGIVLSVICGVIELASPGSVVRAPIIYLATAGLLIWSIGLIFLLRHKDRKVRAQSV
jgi:hypothetical protein